MIQLFRPILAGAYLSQRLVACIGAAVCLALTIAVCRQLPFTSFDLPIIVAPLGASAVLIFAVPASPLAQPWPVLGGNFISSVAGVLAFQVIPESMLAAGVAVGGAILAMSLLRCLHPPGGAAALTAVIGSETIHAAGYGFAFAPVALNSIVIILLAMLFHRLTGQSYPHRPAMNPAALDAIHAAVGFDSQDIDAALEDMRETFDISREDLDALLSKAELHALQRRRQPPAS